jgi:lipopolysaccharide heptosyltransferase I
MPGPIAALAALRPRRVCLIKPSALGDVVNALPVLAALRDHWPDAHLAWVVNHSLRGLLDGHPALDEVIAFDRGGAARSAAGLSRLARLLGTLARGSFDVTIDLQGLFRSGVMAMATRAPVRVGLAEAREGATRFYTHLVSPSAGATHAVDRLLALAEAFGAPRAPARFLLARGPDDERWAGAVLADVPRPRVLLGLGARWETKRWPVTHFAAIARRVVAAHGAGLVAIGAAEDSGRVQELCRLLEPIPLLNLCGRTTLPQLAALTAGVDLVLSNDSGPLHLATAAGAAVIGLYTCTSPERNGPYGAGAEVIQSTVWCTASYLKSCDRLECMSELTPERVWPVVERRLAAIARTLRPSAPWTARAESL